MLYEVAGIRRPTLNGELRFVTALRRPLLKTVCFTLLILPCCLILCCHGYLSLTQLYSLHSALALTSVIVSAISLIIASTIARGGYFLAVILLALVATSVVGGFPLSADSPTITILERTFSQFVPAEIVRWSQVAIHWSVLAEWILLFALLLWWLYGRSYGWSDTLRFPYIVRFDPVLGNRVPLRIPENLVVAYVIYPEWTMYEEVTGDKLTDTEAIPVRNGWLSTIGDDEPSRGHLSAGRQWVSLLNGRVRILGLLDDLDWERTATEAERRSQSFVNPAFNGTSCLRGVDASQHRAVFDLGERSRVGGRSLPRVEKNAPLRVSMRIPQSESPTTIRVRLLREKRSQRQLELVRMARDGYVITPITPWRYGENDVGVLDNIFALMDDITLEVEEEIGPETKDLYPFLIGLGFTKIARHFRLVSDNGDGMLREWTRHIATPAGKTALQYLGWASDLKKVLPKELEIDALTGRINTINESGSGCTVTDLGTRLLVATTIQGVPKELLLPVATGEGAAPFQKRLEVLRELTSMFRRG